MLHSNARAAFQQPTAVTCKGRCASALASWMALSSPPSASTSPCCSASWPVHARPFATLRTSSSLFPLPSATYHRPTCQLCSKTCMRSLVRATRYVITPGNTYCMATLPSPRQAQNVPRHSDILRAVQPAVCDMLVADENSGRVTAYTSGQGASTFCTKPL